MKLKVMTILAISVLSLCIWLIGWAWNEIFNLPKVIGDFITGFGLIATIGYVWTVVKELGV